MQGVYLLYKYFIHYIQQVCLKNARVYPPGPYSASFTDKVGLSVCRKQKILIFATPNTGDSCLAQLVRASDC